mgnify:CR=1 FL=1
MEIVSMGGLLLLSLAMLNVPAYRVIGRLLFGRQERLFEAPSVHSIIEKTTVVTNMTP